MTDRRRYGGRRFSDDERLAVYSLILGGKSYVEIADELDRSL